MSRDKLLPYYERELALLRHSLGEFAGRFPDCATRLSISAGLSEDPQVERLIQSFSLIAARLSMKSDDDTPEFTEALLDVVAPHFLRPIPSYAIAQFSLCNEVKDMGVTTIACGTALKAPPVNLIECRFRTAYDVTLAPVIISHATYSPVVNAPSSVKLPPDATGCISITFSCTGAQQRFAGPGLRLSFSSGSGPDLKKLRTYIHGEPAFVAALRDSLFLHTVNTFVEEDRNGVWLPVHDPAVMTEVGYAEEEGLLPADNNAHPAYRLLSEYVAFPAKFNFFDVNFSRVGLYPAQTHQFTLHRVLNRVSADSNIARVLTTLTATNLRSGCTPIINLFESKSKPVPVIAAASAAAPIYPVALHARDIASYEVYSIDQVTLNSKGGNGNDTTICRPFYSLQHRAGPDANDIYWMMQRNDQMTMKASGYSTEIALVDSNLKPIKSQNQFLNIQLTCTNRDLPAQLSFGSLEGDLMLDEGLVSAALACQIRLLNKPGRSIPVDHERGMQWRLISHLKLNHLSLSQQGMPALREMLLLYNLTNDVMYERQIYSLISISHKASMKLVAANPVTSPRPSFQRGIEIHLTINDNNFVGCSMRGFIHVLDHFFALYTHVNSFTQLIVSSANSGTIICTCEPRPGVIALI